MCLPQAAIAAQTILSFSNNINNKFAENKQQVIANEYRAQVAMNNMRNEEDNARSELQKGIEESRKEKIEGMKKASKLLAQNASSGVLATSDTNYMNFEDVTNESNLNAQDILNSYNSKAESHFQRANSYLNNYNQQSTNYNSSLKKNSLNSLGSYMKVASKWYSGMEDVL